jgi:hypothetical protein
MQISASIQTYQPSPDDLRVISATLIPAVTSNKYSSSVLPSLTSQSNNIQLHSLPAKKKGRKPDSSACTSEFVEQTQTQLSTALQKTVEGHSCKPEAPCSSDAGIASDGTYLTSPSPPHLSPLQLYMP